ncbi:glutamine synthetase family protein [uncultured Sunxiuqinia sp.]|uniref:glutamine synthetase family protein n=1 Tax=uncultured Sunxiuqinia sp. TaxID=1573825 RepID=UPI002AA8829D|nr:glutamine synthetase family protein [uncultured Sunxiuqinia sp.]
MTNKKDLIKTIKESTQSKIKFAVVDIDGILRGKTIHKDKFLEVVDGDIGFCDVIFGWDANDKCYDNVEITGWHTAYPDAIARIDLSTYRNIPWDNECPFFLADFSSEPGKDLPACPRSLLKRIRKRATEKGFEAVFSQEFEWFNFVGTSNELAEKNYSDLKPISPGMFGYSMLRPTQYQTYFNDLFDLLEKFQVSLEGLHTETGPGVYEAAIRYDKIVQAADKAALFKNSVKEIAYQHGIIASFMAKWNDNLPGCSGHIHQSLWDIGQKRNLFFSGDKQSPMSRLMESYLAGQLYCLPHILPMYAPTINSYKRLREGAWAPVTASWGLDNRTTAVRVINGQAKSIRLEMRVPGSDSNPYLAMAAALASGLYGIENELELTIPKTTGNEYAQKDHERLPLNLLDANRKMKDSKIANTLFGEDFVNHFVATREWEWREFAKAVTDWETKRYFEII